MRLFIEREPKTAALTVRDELGDERTYQGYTKKEAVQSFCAEYGHRAHRVAVIEG